jgi:radical SAM protein with 4Fe4S-binding SPASM domain
MQNYKASAYLHFHAVSDDDIIGWNRFAPSIFVINQETLEFLNHIPGNPSQEQKEYLKEFEKHNFIYQGESDHFKNDFIDNFRNIEQEIKQNSERFYADNHAFESLVFTTNECNLACSYCVKSYVKGKKDISIDSTERKKLIDVCIDQYFQRKEIIGDAKKSKVGFNGGEMLLCWDLIKGIVEKINREYDVNVEYSINTNLTLLTSEMADYFKKHDFRISFSIDGYESAHNRTRRYHNGRGSFNDVIEKMEIYKEYFGEDDLIFQGTIENVDSFEPERVYEMAEYGFKNARLAPNLLNATVDDALKKAEVMKRFMMLNKQNSFKVFDTLFKHFGRKIEQEENIFTFNCKGIGSYSPKFLIFNISDLTLNSICEYMSPQVSVRFETLDYDIYNPKLAEVAIKFKEERLGKIIDNCLDCEIVGICEGGCITWGYDSQNKMNKAGCEYQKAVWRYFLKSVYDEQEEEYI